MIVIAPYPNGFHPDMWWCMPGGADPRNLAEPAIIRQHGKVFEHYHNVSSWCKENLTGPYIIDKETDILFDGVRVRVGRESDMAYFQLRWG